MRTIHNNSERCEDMAGGHAKGGVIITRLEHIEEKHGRDAVKKVIARMKEKGYEGPTKTQDFKMAQSYPIDFVLLLVESYLEIYGEDKLDDMSRDVAKRKGIVGWFFKWAGSPEIVLKKAGSYWPNFYDFGRLEGQANGDGKGVLRGYDVSPAPLFCESLTSYYKGVMEYVQAENARVVHTKCVHTGAKHCEWELQWE